MKIDIYNQQGEKTGNLELNKEIFGLSWNDDLIHQVVVSLRSNLRRPIAHAKTRAEVRGGGRKPWRQKGTGRARHGSTRSPIWSGGGVTHGPLNERNFYKKINRKMKKKALYTVLSRKLRDEEILVLESLKLEQPKTKEAQQIFSDLGKISGFEKLKNKRQNRALVLVNKMEENLKRGLRNLPGIMLQEARNLNVLDAMTYKYLIFSKESVTILK